MRKRAQFRSRPTVYEPKYISESKPKTFDKKTSNISKNLWIAVALISIFFLVLLFNTYFNFTSDVAIYSDGEGYSKYLLSGPDPYYNLRLVEQTSKTGVYPYYSGSDPLLNYPLGARGERAPLLNMMALGFSNFLMPFMSETDAIGYAMQFIPALFGALLIFPVFFIGKTLFNKKAGLIAAFFIAIIPIHIGSGHGSAYSLFDHDSFNLLLFFFTFLFMVISLKEKNHNKSILYAVLAGVPLAGLSMVWVEAQFLYVIIAVYAIVQMIIDIFSNKIEINVFRATSVTILVGYLVSLPVTVSKPGGFSFDVPLLMTLLVIGFGVLYYLFGVKKIPWTLSLPFIFVSAAIGLFFLYFLRYLQTSFTFLAGLNKLSNVLFGTGIYGNKVSMTIAEANTYQISQTVMNFGPALYWVGWGGFVFILWYYYKDRLRRDYLFFIVLFIVDLWLTGTAGRFLNDMVPLIAIFAGFITWFVVDKIDYKQMIKNINSAGGGFHGIRRGVKLMHIFGIVLLAFIVILPNVLITFDAAIPSKAYPLNENKTDWSNWKQDYFLDDTYSGVFGLSLYKEGYWVDAFDWLAEQDAGIDNNVDKPAFISWWDYGFYEVAVGEHPTVADNFQDGIPPASNFHTATSEKDAVAVWIVRILEGNRLDGNGKLSDNVKQILAEYLDQTYADKVVGWIETPKSSDSYQTWINEDFNQYMNDEMDTNLLKVGAQWAENAVYHDVVNLFNNETNGLTEEEVTWLYHDLQKETGYSIRYYGVEGYDRQIFNIFAFLSDKSLVLLGGPEDEFVDVLYSGYKAKSGGSGIDYEINNEPLIDYLKKSDIEKRYIAVTGTSYSFKPAYFDTMFYRTYIGPTTTTASGISTYSWQVPCLDMKHFYAEYISNISNPFMLYPGTSRSAVVISKYYEGAFVNGSVYFQGKPISTNVSVVVRKNLSYAPGNPDFDTPIDYDRHELGYKDTTGNFSLIAGAGAYISVIRNPEIRYYEQGVLPFEMANVMFDNEDDSNYSPITEDDAMRKENSNFERFVNITIYPTNISGHVYEDLDKDKKYNNTDKPISNVNIYFYEIEKFDETQIASGMLVPDVVSDFPIQATSNETGFYNVSGLMPGYYALNVYDGDYLINQQIIPFKSGDHEVNIRRLLNSSLSGTVYYNNDDESTYSKLNDTEIAGAEVELQYYSHIRQGYISVQNTTANSEGYYSFTDVIPGTYNINVVESNKYEAAKQLTIDENATRIFNISMDLTSVEVTGHTKYLDEPIEDVEVTFDVDGSVKDNTAKKSTVLTDVNGSYTANLKPGSYNITAQKKDGGLLVYSGTGEKITLSIGQSTASKELSVDKKTVNVTGITSYDGTAIANLTIKFNKDDAVVNNTAEYRSISSDKNGAFATELTPGTYKVTVVNTTFNESGNTYTYYLSEPIALTLSDSDIKNGKTFTIALDRRTA